MLAWWKRARAALTLGDAIARGDVQALLTAYPALHAPLLAWAREQMPTPTPSVERESQARAEQVDSVNFSAFSSVQPRETPPTPDPSGRGEKESTVRTGKVVSDGAGRPGEPSGADGTAGTPDASSFSTPAARSFSPPSSGEGVKARKPLPPPKVTVRARDEAAELLDSLSAIGFGDLAIPDAPTSSHEDHDESLTARTSPPLHAMERGAGGEDSADDA